MLFLLWFPASSSWHFISLMEISCQGSWRNLRTKNASATYHKTILKTYMFACYLQFRFSSSFLGRCDLHLVWNSIPLHLWSFTKPCRTNRSASNNVQVVFDELRKWYVYLFRPWLLSFLWTEGLDPRQQTFLVVFYQNFHLKARLNSFFIPQLGSQIYFDGRHGD